MDAIPAVAAEHLNPVCSETGMKPNDIWNLIGREEGLSRMRANSDVLIALATYAQRWNHDEGLVVAERMRRDGMALRRAVVGIGLGMTCGYGKGSRSILCARSHRRLLLDAAAAPGTLSGEPFGALLELGKCSLSCHGCTKPTSFMIAA
jgi:hypothetical protein